MKRLLTFVLMLGLFCSSAVSAYAAEGNVVYDGNAKKFIFEPGSEYSPTDLFPEMKGVMPGDSISQKITLKNDSSHKVKVDVYMRSLGAHEDSEDFLSQLNLSVKKLEDTELFDANADETAQLTEWVYLGRLYSGGEIELEVVLDVPTSLDNKYSDQIGYLDWQFAVQEYPIEESDPGQGESGGTIIGVGSKTGDAANVILWILLIAAAAAMMLAIKKIKMRGKAKNV